MRIIIQKLHKNVIGFAIQKMLSVLLPQATRRGYQKGSWKGYQTDSQKGYWKGLRERFPGKVLVLLEILTKRFPERVPEKVTNLH